MDYSAPFLTNVWDNPDFNAADIENEFQAMVTRNRAIDSMLSGTLNVDECLDLLNDDGVDVDEYMILTIDNIDRVLREGVPISGWPLLTN